jgi:hypothetical protein
MTSQRNECNYHHRSDLHHVRCPAGSDIRSEAIKHTARTEESNEMLRGFPMATPDVATGSNDRNNPDDCHLTDLALAAERARIDARKNHKRYMDAIYARRRRIREKEDEKELIKEAESMQKLNVKLREENKNLEAIIESAVVKIEAMGEKEMEWFHGVVERSNEKSKNIEEDETSDQLVTKASKRKLKNSQAKSKHTEETDRALKKFATSYKIKMKETTVGRDYTRYDAASTSAPAAQGENDMSRIMSSLERKHPNEVVDETSTHRYQQFQSAMINAKDDVTIEELRKASYLQGLNDARLFNRRDIIAANVRGGLQPQVPSVASVLLNDPVQQQRMDLERLLLLQQFDSLRYPNSSVLHSDLSSLLDNNNNLTGGFLSSSLLSGNASATRYPSDATLALAALQRLNSTMPSATSPPSSLLSGLTPAQLLALSGDNNDTHQLQMQLGILNAYDRSNINNHNTLASLQLQQQQHKSDRSSILAQLHLRQRQSPQQRP